MTHSMGTRRYQIREKIFSLGDDFVIKDEEGISVYNVRSKLLTLGDKLVFEDMAGNRLYKIEEEYWACIKTFKLISPFNNATVATVEEQFSCCFPSFSIKSIYGHYEIDGSIGAYSFKLTKNGKIVATVDKEFFAFSDTYGVEIIETEDPAFILALVIVLDQICHDD
uniref:Uncharacterized protein n=1 Tax=Panagrolaimus davidi TaxID=227884 RepID=A0A914QF90_9BILA